jgi:hypothetical protein
MALRIDVVYAEIVEQQRRGFRAEEQSLEAGHVCGVWTRISSSKLATN